MQRSHTAIEEVQSALQGVRVATVQELFDLSGRVAIVTGAGTGLGVAFAEALAEAGAAVVCAGRTLARIEHTAAGLRERGFRAVAIRADVTVEDEVIALVQDAERAFGNVDILVNNAGIAIGSRPESLSLADWTTQVNVNQTGVFLCAREVARSLIAAGRGGSIINIASVLGMVASQPTSVTGYAASKGAVVNLTRDLAVHWAAKSIRVNAIAPGYFPSEMTADLLDSPERTKSIVTRTPMRRVGSTEELKGAVVFLASQASSYVTGQILAVDGGWTAW
jgi:NAD(P)-dependent dehydrogenase (short-subunit alcohol dehydrogenase family)